MAVGLKDDEVILRKYVKPLRKEWCGLGEIPR
jgi:hypothetical protein